MPKMGFQGLISSVGAINAAYIAVCQIRPTLSKNECAYQSDKFLPEGMNVLFSLSQPLLSHYRNRISRQLHFRRRSDQRTSGKQPSCCFPWVNV